MKRFLVYTRLRLKTVMKIFPAMCVMTLLLCLSLGGMLYLQSAQAEDIAEGDEKALLSIGIVGIDTSGFLDPAFSLLGNMDASRSEVKFIQYETREDAADAIRNNEILAAIVIPEGVVPSLLAGEPEKMTLLFPGSQAGFGALMIREMADAVSLVIGDLESASYTLADYYVSQGVPNLDKIAESQTNLLLTSLQNAMHRDRLFQIKYVPTQTQISIESFYLIAAMFLLILFLGIMCAGKFIRSNYALAQLLRFRSFGSLPQVLSEYISLVVLLTAVCALFAPIIAVSLSRLPITFSAFGVSENVFISRFLLFCAKSVPVILLAAALDVLIYELSSSLITGIPALFLITIALAYAGGAFYTVSTMPPFLQKLSSVLPTGQALLYMQHLAKISTGSVQYLWLVLGWTALFLALTVLLRHRNISGKGGLK